MLRLRCSDCLIASRGKLEVAELRVEDIEKHEIEEQDVTSATTSLSPPEAMFRPIEYPPLHIFVSILLSV